MGGAAIAASAPSTAPPEGAVADLVAGLESPQFEVRDAASRRLAALKQPAIAGLTAAAKTRSLDAAVRAVGVLETIFVLADEAGDPAALDAAESALEDLSRSERASIATRAESVLDAHYEICERRAIAQIEHFNGVVHFDDTADSITGWARKRNAILAPLPKAPERNPKTKGVPRALRGVPRPQGELMFALIGPKWAGGDEGLQQIARLKRLRQLYWVEGAPVSSAAILRLRSQLPGLEIETRGAAKLGIRPASMFLADEKGCRIGRIDENEAAENAGLQVNDLIVQFGGQPVEGFNALVEMLRHRKPEETVPIGIQRNGRSMTINVTLTGWD
jgi:hypothetical protein